jgi:uncharacterized cupin superfamily protein
LEASHAHQSGETVYRDHRRDAELPDLAKEVSVFDWEYDATETCYVMEGEVKVTTPEGEFGAGDLVTFPRGLKCTWNVRKPIRKHYRF